MHDKRYKIVYEDDALVVADKPSGMLVIPTPKGETNTLTDLLNKELDSRGEKVNVYPCHRIDRETSGLVIYAKGKSVQRLMMDRFRERAVKKEYIAFAHGRLKNMSGIIKGYIYNRNKFRDELAITKYKVTAHRPAFDVLSVEPVTGRTNQIRIQFKAIGHPLVGETVYAFRKDFKLKFKRVALHAAMLEFAHPVTKKIMKFNSTLPSDMDKLLN